MIIANNRSVSATLHHINARSICNKITDFHEYVTEANPTLCAITETWLSDDEQDLRFKEVPPTGYNIISKPRTSGKKGGGLAIIYKSCLTVKELPGLTRPSEVMELLEILVNFKGILCNIYTVYCIPNTSVIHLVEAWNSLEQYIGLKEDKLSSTTADLIRSEGNLETKHLYSFRKPKMC